MGLLRRFRCRVGEGLCRLRLFCAVYGRADLERQPIVSRTRHRGAGNDGECADVARVGGQRARNFNPAAAMAGKICVVEVEQIVETGAMDPDQIHLPGVYVHRLVLNAHPEKRIEKRTITETSGV